MSASAIVDSLVQMYQAASAFGTSAGITYSVLETTSGSAVVVSFAGMSEAEDTLGGGLTEVTWRFNAEGFVKSTNRPTADLGRNAPLVDTILAPIRADRTLQGTVEDVTDISGERELPPDGFVEIGGFIWHRVNFIITAKEWPSG